MFVFAFWVTVGASDLLASVIHKRFLFWGLNPA